MDDQLTHSVRISIVDLLGIFLPGVVWALLLLGSAGVPASTRRGTGPVLLDAAFSVIDKGATSPTLVFSGFVVFALLCGYVQKSLGVTVIERIARLDQLVVSRWHGRKLPKSERRRQTATRLFPYDCEHAHREYYRRLVALLTDRVGADSDNLGRQPFSGCKRLLRLHAPALWEETEVREAQVRLLSSLALAATANVVLTIVLAVVANATWKQGLASLAPALATWLVLVIGFRNQHQREVKFVYLNTLLAVPFITGDDMRKLESVSNRSA